MSPFRTCVLVNIVLSFSACSPSQPSADKNGEKPDLDKVKPPEVVAPKPKEPNNLGSFFEIDGYLVRPPKGYPVVETPAIPPPPGANFHSWGGTKRKDGTAPFFGVMIGRPPPNEPIPSSLDECLALMLEGARKHQPKNWTQSPFEDEKIGELLFKRSRWSGTNLRSGLKIHGTNFVAIDGKTIIQIFTQDVEPHHVEALKLSEKAAQSFRRK